MKERKMGDQKCYKMTTDSIQNIPPHFASNEGKKEKKKKKVFTKKQNKHKQIHQEPGKLLDFSLLF